MKNEKWRYLIWWATYEENGQHCRVPATMVSTFGHTNGRSTGLVLSLSSTNTIILKPVSNSNRKLTSFMPSPMLVQYSFLMPFKYIYIYIYIYIIYCFHDAGIKPDDKFYEIKDIERAIKEAIGFAPGIECNKDSSHNSQLYQIYLCVDTSASNFINCPVMPHGRCDSRVQFPKF